MFFEEDAMVAACPALMPAVAALKKANTYVVHLDNEQSKILINLFEEACRIFESNGFLQDCENVCIFGQVLSYIVQNVNKDNDEVSYNTARHEILKILAYVNSNIAEPLTVESIARKFNMSSTTLWHMMKRNMGMSLKEYILKIRIAKAMQLLSKGLSVTEVADKTGFNSYSHFIRTFTKTVGTSPYRYSKRV